jgi:hypothetical protein
LQLGLALANYGPEAKGARAQLRQGLGKTIDEIWSFRESDVNFVAKNFAAAIQNLLQQGGDPGCAPSFHCGADPGARKGKGHGPINRPIAITNVLRIDQSNFYSPHRDRRRLGDMSLSQLRVDVRGNAMSFVAVAVGALAVASATYLIFDLSGPYTGIFRASSGRSNKCWRSWIKSDRFAYVVTRSHCNRA